MTKQTKDRIQELFTGFSVIFIENDTTFIIEVESFRDPISLTWEQLKKLCTIVGTEKINFTTSMEIGEVYSEYSSDPNALYLKLYIKKQ